MKRWADENETHEALLISLIYLCYITGEIVHLVEAGICLIYEMLNNISYRLTIRKEDCKLWTRSSSKTFLHVALSV